MGRMEGLPYMRKVYIYGKPNRIKPTRFLEKTPQRPKTSENPFDRIMTKAFPEIETRGLVLMKGLYSVISPADHHTSGRIQKRKIIRKTLQQVVDKRHAVYAVADTMKALDSVTSRLQHMTVRRRSHYGAARFKSLEALIDAHVKEVLDDQKKSVDGSSSVAADPLVPRLRHLSMNDEDPLSSRLGDLSVNDADAVAIGSYSDPTWVQFLELSVN